MQRFKYLSTLYTGMTTVNSGFIDYLPNFLFYSNSSPI